MPKNKKTNIFDFRLILPDRITYCLETLVSVLFGQYLIIYPITSGCLDFLFICILQENFFKGILPDIR